MSENLDRVILMNGFTFYFCRLLQFSNLTSVLEAAPLLCEAPLIPLSYLLSENGIPFTELIHIRVKLMRSQHHEHYLYILRCLLLSCSCSAKLKVHSLFPIKCGLWLILENQFWMHTHLDEVHRN